MFLSLSLFLEKKNFVSKRCIEDLNTDQAPPTPSQTRPIFILTKEEVQEKIGIEKKRQV